MMSKVRRFEHRFRVKASLGAVAAFHQDSRALKLLTPPPVFVQMHRVEPLAEGSVADFTLWLGPLPVRWVAVHTQVDPRTGFKDRQERGPFASWVHRHIFRAVDAETTEVIDEVEAEFGGGMMGLIGRLMWLNLPLMFAYRGWATRRALEKPLSAKGVVSR
jgi:ligand-binding SRPBCC domain-containing protein